MSIHVKEAIQNAFAKALSLGKTGDIRPKPELVIGHQQRAETVVDFTPTEIRAMRYTEQSALVFTEEADALTKAALKSDQIASAPVHRSMLTHRSYYVGSLNKHYTAEQCFQEALDLIKKSMNKEKKKKSLMSKLAGKKSA